MDCVVEHLGDVATALVQPIHFQTIDAMVTLTVGTCSCHDTPLKEKIIFFTSSNEKTIYIFYTHTHTHIYIYIYIVKWSSLGKI